MTKRGSLATQFGAPKRQDEITPKRLSANISERQEAEVPNDGKRLSLRVNGAAWRELQYLRIEQGRTVHSLPSRRLAPSRSVASILPCSLAGRHEGCRRGDFLVSIDRSIGPKTARQRPTGAVKSPSNPRYNGNIDSVQRERLNCPSIRGCRGRISGRSLSQYAAGCADQGRARPDGVPVFQSAETAAQGTLRL